MKRFPFFVSLLLNVSITVAVQAAPVIAIADGDTLTVLEDQRQIKVRLSDIDAPEKKQAFGQRSRQSLSELCFGKDARLDVRGKDRYGRTIARVFCAGVDANRAQVERGMAWVYTGYNIDPGLPDIEQQARAARAGLWADPEPTPPWQWRKARKKPPAP